VWRRRRNPSGTHAGEAADAKGEVTMPVDIRIIHAHEFIRATTEGKLDLEASKELLKALAAASADSADYNIAVDTRATTSEMSVADLWHLASELSEHFRARFSRPLKTAVLCPTGRFDSASFFALCAQNRGFNVRAFTSFEDAYSWLAGGRS
jgi:hypothetical protein